VLTSFERDALRFYDAYGKEEGFVPTFDPDLDY
jgi:hypothetical protein